jgi:hypothetical protein
MITFQVVKFSSPSYTITEVISSLSLPSLQVNDDLPKLIKDSSSFPTKKVYESGKDCKIYIAGIDII